MAADCAMRLKDVNMVALDRITKEMKWLSESVRKMNDRQPCFESVLKLGPGPMEDQRIDLMPGRRPTQ